MLSIRPEKAPQLDEVTLMGRKYARSIYELSTRPDKGPLLISNGVLEALSVLSGVRACYNAAAVCPRATDPLPRTGQDEACCKVDSRH